MTPNYCNKTDIRYITYNLSSIIINIHMVPMEVDEINYKI